MRYHQDRGRATEEPTGRDWPILLLIGVLGLMLWGPILMVFLWRG